MASAFQRKRDDDLNRFYTRSPISAILARLLPNLESARILDLGAGMGSLSAIAGKQALRPFVVTVDIDRSISPLLKERFTRIGLSEHVHHTFDVLDPNLAANLQYHGEFDIAVCNPPFFRPKWIPEFETVLREGGLDGIGSDTGDVTAETLFLAQNLRLLRDGGTLALIVPDGFATGWPMAKIREKLLSEHAVDSVVQLPPHSFHDTEARCFIILIRKNDGPTKVVNLYKINEATGDLSSPLSVPHEDGINRLDYEYHREHVKSLNGDTLISLNADIRRGSINYTNRADFPYPLFHTSDFKSAVDGRLTAPLAPPPQNSARKLIVAEQGDILLARIDRNLHQKVCIVVEGAIAVTDCIYRIRVPKQEQTKVFESLRSKRGADQLLGASKGVGARLLGKADLLKLRLIER